MIGDGKILPLFANRIVLAVTFEWIHWGKNKLDKIEFNCSSCGSELRVDRAHAGRKARCPKCGMIHNVPGGTGAPSGSGPGISSPGSSIPTPSHSHPGEMPTHVLGGKWEMRATDGSVYGPVDRSELDEWANEGRVSPSCYLRQEGGDWFPAEQIYPHVSGASPVQSSTPHYVSEQNSPHPYAGDQGYGNPYAAPMQSQGPPSQPMGLRPHNGGAILTCGIIGLLCCWIFAIMAWVMGSRDLAAIKRGEMDPAGKGLVTAGYILGIIGVCLNIGLLILGFLGEVLDF